MVGSKGSTILSPKSDEMNLQQIQTEVYQRCRLGASPANDVVQMVLTFVNNRHREILTAKGMDKLRDGTVSFSVTQNTAVYSLPANIAKVKFISDPARNYWKLDERDLSWLRQSSRSGAAQGEPTDWVPLGIRSVASQPSATTRLYVVSDGTDTGNAVVSYTVQGGAQYTQVVTLNSGSAVQVGTSNVAVSVERFQLQAAANGTVTLQTTALGGDILSTIPPGHTGMQYLGVQFFPTPAQNTTFLIDHSRNIPDLVNAYDEPALPFDFHRLLPLGARIDVYEFKDDSVRKQEAMVEYEALKRRLMDYVSNGPDRLIVPGDAPSSFSPLGPNYPATGWL